MDTVIKVMDLDVNIMDMETFGKKVEGYLESEQPNMLMLATSQLFIEVAEREELRTMLSTADMIIPGEETFLTMYPIEEVEHSQKVIINYKTLSELLIYLNKSHYTMYVVARNEKELQIIIDFLKYARYNISVVGGRIREEAEDELIINEINGLVPDVLLVDLDTPLQELWMMEHKIKVNTKLCIGLGEILQQMIAGHGKIPSFLYTLHLDGIYKKMVLEHEWVKKRQREKFKRKVMEYKEKKNEDCKIEENQ